MSLSATVADAVTEGGRHPFLHNHPDWLIRLELSKMKALFFWQRDFHLILCENAQKYLFFCGSFSANYLHKTMHAVCKGLKIVSPNIHIKLFHYLILFIN